MKRHPQLQPLSDDHHAALVLAREVRRAGEAAADRAALARVWREAQARFARELEPHFQVEEAALFPPLEAAGEGALAARACRDHARLRELIAGAAGGAEAIAFGALLHGHVRFEERELFPRAEQVLGDAGLEAVGRAARAARPARR